MVSTLAQSYLHVSSHSAAGTAELAASRKKAKYSCLPRDFFVPIAVVETLRATGLSDCKMTDRKIMVSHYAASNKFCLIIAVDFVCHRRCFAVLF